MRSSRVPQILAQHAFLEATATGFFLLRESELLLPAAARA
jgi:hypothetical protein